MTPSQVSQLSLRELEALLRHGRFGLITGSLVSRIRTELVDVAAYVHRLYGNHPFLDSPEFSDFHVGLRRPRNVRRWFRPQVHFVMEGEQPFEPLPRDQAPAFLEWGLNWSVASYCHQWFSLHAASLESNGHAVILPAPPGSGKSTLCAALAFRDWRLLSDELTLLDPQTGKAHALARPINLKNSSIDIIGKFAPDAVWGETVFDTVKGHVTHLQPPASAVSRMDESATPRWIVFPRYLPKAAPLLTPKPKTETFIALAKNAFNYSILGEIAFNLIGDIVERCDCYDFSYSDLDDATEVFSWLSAGAGEGSK